MPLAKPLPEGLALTEQDLDWLWPRYQRCTFPIASFPKRFANHTRASLTEKGRKMALSLAFQYRRQIFHGSAKWDAHRFLAEVRDKAAAENRPTPPPQTVWPMPGDLTF